MTWQPWEQAVGSSVVALIQTANFGRWPTNLDEWVEVANRYSLYVSIGPAGTFLYGSGDTRVAFIKYTPSRRRLYDAIAHEVAEHLVRTECEQPFNFKGGRRFFHRVALYVQRHGSPGGVSDVAGFGSGERSVV